MEEEKEDKLKRIATKLEGVMAEVAEDLIDDEIKEKLDEKFKDLFKKEGLPMTIMTLQSFYEGLKMGMSAYSSDSDGQLPFLLVAYTRMLIVQKKKDVSKKADDAMTGGVNHGL